ncbi:hypothetical protein ACF0H5_021299 [Mactra antiquata]
MSSEHLAPVHDNFFIRQYGLPHHSQQVPVDNECSISSSRASSERGDDDTDQEYHVNSGFVNKLRSKFAQLENKGQRPSLSRKSASVENLLSIGSSSESSYKGRRWLKDDYSLSKVEMRKPDGYKPQIRPRSSDIVETGYTNKPVLPQKKKDIDFLKQSHIRSVKPPLPKKGSIDTTSKYKNYYRKPSADSIVPKPEHHDWKVAPDLEKIGRDNLIIIENEKVIATPAAKEEVKSRVSVNDDDDKYRQVKPVTEQNRVSDENEMPKPNTVSNFRTLFEKPGKALKPLNAWRQLSPPRKSSSGTISPSVASPRSPLAKVTDDNVFDDSSKISVSSDHDKSVSLRNSAPLSPRNSATLSPRNSATLSPRNSSNIDTNVSPRNSSSISDYSQNVDTNSTSMQQSLDLFKRRSSVDIKERPKSENRSSVEYRSSIDLEAASEPLSPRAQSSPVHPLSKVFDSKSLPKDKPKRPKPQVVIKKQKPIPKDTIELKHDADRLISEKLNIEEKVEIIDIPKVKDEGVSRDDFSFEGVSNESTVKPSSKKSGKISPRKTKIFDSSNILKKDKEAPKSPMSPVENLQPFVNNVPKQIKVSDNLSEQTKLNFDDDDDDNEIRTSVEIVPVRPPRRNNEQSINGMTELKPNIVPSEKTEFKTKPREFKVKESNFTKPSIPNIVNDTEKVKPSVEKDSNEPVITGMSSFLASRLKKTQPNQEGQSKSSSVHLSNGSLPSPVPRKRQAPNVPLSNGTSAMEVETESNKEAPPLPTTPQPTFVKMNTDRKKKQQSSTKMVFDSSKIATKRKEPPKRKPARKTLEQLNENITFDSDPIVPKLDLSSLDKPNNTEYQEGYIPTVIKPCTIKFIGAEVTFANSPYKKKTKAKKAKIMFAENAPTTFEYEDEETALEKYLMEHPEERDEAMRQEDEINGVIVEPKEELLHDSPRAPPMEPDTTMKSNTIIGSSAGGFTSYKSKIQVEEFQFGKTPEPEPEYFAPEPDQVTGDAFDLLPAEENDTFSAEVDKADMLF